MAKLTAAQLRAQRADRRLTRRVQAVVRTQSRQRGQPVTRREQRAAERAPRSSVWD